MDQLYTPTPDGLIGNEDCGQMSAWYVFSAAGFYPVTPGSTTYAIGSPLFPEMRFSLENGKSFVVKAEGVSDRNVYIQSATLNGKPYSKSYLEHADLMAGGQLVFTMGSQPNRFFGLGFENQSVSKIDGPEIVSVPVIKAPSTAFKNQLMISLQSQTKVYYTTDGSEPTLRSTRFVRPFRIDRNTTVKAIAVDARGRRSAVVTGTFHRIPHDWRLTLLTRYSSQYPAGGDSSVIDGLRGTTNWSGGAWQGYWENDFEAMVDLGKVQRLTKVGAGFLQDIGSWIWFPRRLEVELSKDGKTFTPAASITFTTSNTTIKDFVQAIAPQDARYVRLRAVNSGKNTWIFTDEILIEN
jgi:hypothetical protein